MKTLTKTLKLPFLNLNIVKAQEFSVLAQENCTLANEILSIGLKDRQKLTSKSFPNSLLNSSFVNQTIRNVLAKKTAKTFKLNFQPRNCLSVFGKKRKLFFSLKM